MRQDYACLQTAGGIHWLHRIKRYSLDHQMKAKKLIGISVAIGVLSLNGCWTMQAKMPDLHSAKWKSLEVEYLVKTDSGEERKVWSTADPTVLDRLQKSLKIASGGDLWGYGTMTSNKIGLELANGRKYILHVNSDTQLCLNDYEKAKTGWGIHATADFQQTLKQLIKTATKEDVSWYH
jgi:hypothetical protein